MFSPVALVVMPVVTQVVRSLVTGATARRRRKREPSFAGRFLAPVALVDLPTGGCLAFSGFLILTHVNWASVMNDSPLLRSVATIVVRLEVVAAKLFAILGRLPAQASEWLSIREAAKSAALSPTKIRREIKAGHLPASNAGSSSRPLYRIQKSDLHSWLDKRKGGTEVPPEVRITKRRIKSRYFPDM